MSEGRQRDFLDVHKDVVAAKDTLIRAQEKRIAELEELRQGVASMVLCDVNGGKENCLHNGCKWDAATYVQRARALVENENPATPSQIPDDRVRSNEVRADGGRLYCEADQGESHRPGCAKEA